MARRGKKGTLHIRHNWSVKEEKKKIHKAADETDLKMGKRFVEFWRNYARVDTGALRDSVRVDEHTGRVYIVGKPQDYAYVQNERDRFIDRALEQTENEFVEIAEAEMKRAKI